MPLASFTPWEPGENHCPPDGELRVEGVSGVHPRSLYSGGPEASALDTGGRKETTQH